MTTQSFMLLSSSILLPPSSHRAFIPTRKSSAPLLKILFISVCFIFLNLLDLKGRGCCCVAETRTVPVAVDIKWRQRIVSRRQRGLPLN